MGINKIKEIILEMKFEDKNDILKIEIIDTLDGKPCGSFNLSDEKFDNINNFIDFLLGKVETHGKLTIEFNEANVINEIHKKLCLSFKKIWEEDYAKIIKDINENVPMPEIK